MATAPISQAMTEAPPMSWAAAKEPSSHPEPMIEVSEAQVAPISPISRLSPTSPGLMSGPSLTAMVDSSFLDSHAPRGLPPVGRGAQAPEALLAASDGKALSICAR